MKKEINSTTRYCAARSSSPFSWLADWRLAVCMVIFTGRLLKIGFGLTLFCCLGNFFQTSTMLLYIQMTIVQQAQHIHQGFTSYKQTPKASKTARIARQRQVSY